MALMLVASFLPQDVTELGIDSKGGRQSDLSILRQYNRFIALKWRFFKAIKSLHGLNMLYIRQLCRLIVFNGRF
jgi:hypothetical protein